MRIRTEIGDASTGVTKRVEQGLIGPEFGEGFHGVLGDDVDGDGEADASTFIVTPEDEIPVVAQESGAEDEGIVNVCVFIAC